MTRQFKGFSIGQIQFFPCECTDSKSAGYRWFVSQLKQDGYWYDESAHRKFRTKTECREYAADIDCQIRQVKNYADAEARRRELLAR